MKNYVYRPKEKAVDFNECCTFLEHNHSVIREWTNGTAPRVVSEIKREFEKLDIKVLDYHVDITEYKAYLKAANYFDHFSQYCKGYKNYISEKMFEHYVALQLLAISKKDVFIDIASESSPVPDIYSRLTGCKSYRQDIMYPCGMHGNKIGGDACDMPIPDQFADKVSLTCSLEHFEGDSDQKLFHELNRVLRTGGKACIIPFYLYSLPANQTDPTVSVPSGVLFDSDAIIFCAEGWGNRFARFYSPDSFRNRIYSTNKDFFDFEVFHIVNATEVDENIYARFSLVARKK